MGMSAGRLWVSMGGGAASSAFRFNGGAHIPTQTSRFEGGGLIVRFNPAG
jgi:hypothetical protein